MLLAVFGGVLEAPQPARAVELLPSTAGATDAGLKAKLTRSLHDEARPSASPVTIDGLTFYGDTESMPVKEKLDPASGRIFRWATLRGVFKPSSKDDGLVCTYTFDRYPYSVTIKPGKGGRFAVDMPLQGDRAYFELTAVDRRGQDWIEHFRVDCPSCLNPPRSAFQQARPGGRAWSLTPSLGFAYLDYTEGLKAPYSAMLIAPGLAFGYALSDAWELGADAAGGLLSLGASNPSVGARLFRGNAWVGGAFGASWRTTIQVGGYLMSLSSANDTLGFNRLTGPQLTLFERKALDPKNALVGYLRYGAVLEGAGISFSERELAAGLGFERVLGTTACQLSLGVSALDFAIGRLDVRARTYSGTLSFRF